jgi:carboxylesterase type B
VNTSVKRLQGACLRAVSTSDLQKAAPEAPDNVIYSALNSTDFQPHVDGAIVPAQPWTIGPQVPMIFGSNKDEGELFALGAYQTANVSASEYSSFLTTNFGPAAPIVEKQYPLTLPAFASTGFPAFAAISTIITESLFHCPAYQAMLKAQSENIPVYAYFNSHTPTCQWLTSLPAMAIPYVGATHTSDVPFIFGNTVGLPLPNGNCSFTVQENAISESYIAAWTAMASTGNPSVQGGLQWPQWSNCTNQGVNVVDLVSVGVMEYSQCAFWDMIDNMYLNFTSLSANDTSRNASSGGGKSNGARRGVEMGV